MFESEALNYMVAIVAILMVLAVYQSYRDNKRRKIKEKKDFCLIDYAGGKAGVK